MSVRLGSFLGSYEVTELLGKGGMGEVYRARDSKLKRDVAIKVLPEEFGANDERVSRFCREAEVLASFIHPNIAAIYEFAQSGPFQFLVLELVPGETLASRIARGPMPVAEVLSIARQIAEALATAHEKDVIHRDLKPANIKITPDGNVKVLDFGLAKTRPPSVTSSLSESPTRLTSPSTGVMMGTVAYMSPEQAKGEEASFSADVWSFGCVVYEMLTGHEVFAGQTVAEVLGAIFKEEPDWSRLPGTTPVSIRRMLRRCLQKDGKRRLRHIADARVEIDEAFDKTDVAAEEPAVHVPARRRKRVVWIAVTALFTLTAALIAAVFFHSPVPVEVRADITTPVTTDLISFALSPDGQKLAFSAVSNNQSRLWIRPLNSTTARPVFGTEGASGPFWSPDGRFLAFFAEGKLKRIDVTGGAPQILANAPNNRGGTWSSSGVIVFAPGPAGPLYRISDQGGEPVAVTHLDAPNQTGHLTPQFLPDGNHLLFYVLGIADSQGTYVVALDGSGQHRLPGTDSGRQGSQFALGHLFFMRQGALFAQPFDLHKLELSGSPFAIAEQIAFDGLVPALSTSLQGPIAYRAGGAAASQHQLIWFDRAGKEIERVGDQEAASGSSIEVSPDGRTALLTRAGSGTAEIWSLELQRGAILSRLTLAGGWNGNPVWSTHGDRIAFTSNRKGPFNIYVKSMTNESPDSLVVEGPDGKSPTDWSPDGRFLLYRALIANSHFDLMAKELDSEREPFPVAQTGFDEREGQFSPDGKWIAYQSNESGHYEIYIQAFPGPARHFRVSSEGGSQTRWRHDGKELFYIALDGRMMAVPIQLDSATGVLAPGAPNVLFRPRMAGGVMTANFKYQYAVSRDGQRFLINSLFEDSSSSPITLILNWHPESRK